MHHALLISEVSQEICGTLAILDQSTLPAVARTCRALCDPALDELWRELYSVHPFVHLLTCDTDGEIHQPLTSQRWSTFRKYSARTRSLGMCMIDDLPHFNRFPCLVNLPNPDSFFPNLRAVAWYPNDHLAMLPFFRLLCGPALTSLTAEFAIDPTSLSMLASLGDLCPNIVDISISAASATLSDDLANALSTSICRWKDLQCVSCDDLTFSAMEHLSQAKNLVSLTACASGSMSSPLSRPNYMQESSFSRLQHLHLYAGLLSTATSCLRGLHLALTDFKLDLFDTEEVFFDLSNLRELLATLAEACARTCLANLYLCVIYPHLPSPDWVATIRDIRPLLVFSHIRVVSFDGFPAFSFADEDIDELASAWPHIEKLALSTYVHHPVASLPTIRSLICLARSCPKLRSLSLVVDTIHVDLASFSMAGHDARSSALHYLCLGNSPINSPIAVSWTLHALYPALKQVDLSVWNKEPLNHLALRDRYELAWGTVNIELSNLVGQSRGLSVCGCRL